jgi:chromosomal replication initiator protein
MNEKEVWNIVLGELETTLSKANFQTWFPNTHLVKIDNGEVTIGVPNDFVKDWLEGKYKMKVLEIMRNHFPSIRSVVYAVKTIKKDPTITHQHQFATENRVSQALPLENRDDGLNPRYTFKQFIIGGFNELAYAASQAIIKSPGQVYNPFFVYGNTGLGKTHLIQATGHAVKQNFPFKKIYYTSFERFLNDYVDSIKRNSASSFKEKYRKFDCLIMDDIQFISGKEKAQEELFHLFNNLHNENKQIIFSSDRHPNMIVGLEDRLKSRFGAGMIVDISNPEYESKLLILKEKVGSRQNLIGDEVVSYIAENYTGNIRELEGIINVIIAQSELRKLPIHINDVKQIMKNHTKEKTSKTPEDIIEMVSKYFSTNPQLISGKTRRQDVVYPRQICIYILREFLNSSYQAIGEKLGGRDHTTIMHSYEKVKQERLTNAQINKELDEIKQILT